MKHIVLIGTSDTHGNISGGKDGGLDRLSTYLKNVRAENENVIFMDAGDSLVSENAAKAMKELGVDVCCVGNHDFDKGIEAYFAYKKSLDAPIICGNLYTKDELLLIGEAYTVFEIDGINIAFIGVTTPYLPLLSKNFENESHNYKCVAAPDAVGKIIKEVSSKADAVVLIAHLDYYGEYDPFNGSDSGRAVIDGNTEIDLALFAHSHISECGDRNGILYAESEDMARTAVRFDLYFDDNNRIYEKNVELINLNQYDSDKSFGILSDIGINNCCFKSMNTSRLCNTPLTEWVGRVMCEKSGCDVACVNYPYGLFSENREISTNDIKKLFPFKNHLYKVEMSVKKLKEYILWSVKCFEVVDDKIVFADGYPDYYQDLFYGLDYEIVLLPENKAYIDGLKIGDKELCDEEIISVAITNFRVNINLRRLNLIENEPEIVSAVTLDRMFEDAIESGDNKLNECRYRWEVKCNNNY